MEGRRAVRSGSLCAPGLSGCISLLRDAAKGLTRRDSGSGDGRAGNGASGDLDHVGARGVEIGLGHPDLVVAQVVDHVRRPQESVAE